ncbi:hypothetical protein BDB00DRAFT_860113 [Zychaea mexicana]|uniref:uncharacterized protein n=1 Tax=Zychaea mexicana TaxID=64656 RepID=UPI0022FEF15F|nr:uncharacterized protein BDB00DRAFT_860113 [Zychaea mexicana]KAI9474853.1 hypothetical protein BDB00DRAFT_860113 [Zychaea mexicana]
MPPPPLPKDDKSHTNNDGSSSSNIKSRRGKQKKDDLTRKDIANLYSQLESVVEKVPSPSPQQQHQAMVLSPDATNSTPTLSAISTPGKSPSSPAAVAETPCDCPHRHIFTRNETTCALCDQEIPQLTQLARAKAELVEAHTTASSNEQKLIELQALKETNEQRLEHTTQQLESLRRDMQVLNDKYVDEIERVGEIQHAKALVENELEELSQRLFEEANGMVASEKREKFNLQEAYKHLQEKFDETRERLAAEEMQLKELREKMQEGEEQQRSLSINGSSDERMSSIGGGGGGDSTILSPASDDPEGTAAYDLAEMFRRQLQISTTHRLPPDGTDTMLVENFSEYVIASPNIALKKLYTLPFLKYCLAEDIEPCLRFGPNSRLSARKLIDAITLNACFIEDTPPGFVQAQAKKHFISETPLKISALKLSMWERFSSDDSGVFQGCQACGRLESPLPYRFRISYLDDWACIDRYCRDRLVAVCEFFVFIRNIRQGYYNRRTIPDLYHESIRLRLQMFYARMGVLPWILRSLGVKGDALGVASEPQMSVPPTPEAIIPPSPFRDDNDDALLSPQSPAVPPPPPTEGISTTPSASPASQESYRY